MRCTATCGSTAGSRTRCTPCTAARSSSSRTSGSTGCGSATTLPSWRPSRCRSRLACSPSSRSSQRCTAHPRGPTAHAACCTSRRPPGTPISTRSHSPAAGRAPSSKASAARSSSRSTSSSRGSASRATASWRSRASISTATRCSSGAWRKGGSSAAISSRGSFRSCRPRGCRTARAWCSRGWRSRATRTCIASGSATAGSSASPPTGTRTWIPR